MSSASAASEELTRLRRENRIFRQERDILRKVATHLAAQAQIDPDWVYRFIEAEQGNHPIKLLCQLLGVPTSSWYYRQSTQGRPPSAAELENARVLRLIQEIQEASGGPPHHRGVAGAGGGGEPEAGSSPDA